MSISLQWVSVFATLLLTYVQTACSMLQNDVTLNGTKCPYPYEIQTQDVATNFSVDYYIGIYYEIAIHDKTQYPEGCPWKPYCIQSIKLFDNQTTGHKQLDKYGQIADCWTMQCDGGFYDSMFFDNITESKGIFALTYMQGNIVLNKYRKMYDIIVATGNIVQTESNLNGKYVKKMQYEWVIEYQCIQGKKNDTILFNAVQFYCIYNLPPQSLIDEMFNVAYNQGLGYLLNESIFYVNQENCLYPNYTGASVHDISTIASAKSNKRIDN